MNYIHSYHAGNFADCFKHLVLLAHLDHLNSKPSPYFCLDTHAGAGLYHLLSPQAQKTLEFRNGIEKLWHHRNNTTLKIASKYLQTVAELNQGALEYFPGSPEIISRSLRPGDRLVACELNPGVAKVLKNNYKRTSQVGVHATDGYQSLKAFLPPAENRGLVLIDPSFETGNEWRTLTQQVLSACQRWPNGHFIIWYPIKEVTDSGRLQRKLKAAGLGLPMVSLEFKIKAPSRFALYANGVVLINPPWRVPERIGQEIIPYLSRILEDVQPNSN